MYESYINEVVTVLSNTGEIVGRLEKVGERYLTLKEPRLFVMGEQGTGFAQGISLTSQMNPPSADIQMSSVITVLPSNQEVQEGWMQQTSGIVM